MTLAEHEDDWVDDEFDPDLLLMDCDHCGERVEEGFKLSEDGWQFWCSTKCMAADGHDPAGAYSTVTELGDDLDGEEAQS